MEKPLTQRWRQKAAFSRPACRNRITYYLSIWRWGREPWTPFWRGLRRSLCLWEPVGRPRLRKNDRHNVNTRKSPVSKEETRIYSCISLLSPQHFTFCLPHQRTLHLCCFVFACNRLWWHLFSSVFDVHFVHVCNMNLPRTYLWKVADGNILIYKKHVFYMRSWSITALRAFIT